MLHNNQHHQIISSLSSSSSSQHNHQTHQLPPLKMKIQPLPYASSVSGSAASAHPSSSLVGMALSSRMLASMMEASSTAAPSVVAGSQQEASEKYPLSLFLQQQEEEETSSVADPLAITSQVLAELGGEDLFDTTPLPHRPSSQKATDVAAQQQEDDDVDMLFDDLLEPIPISENVVHRHHQQHQQQQVQQARGDAVLQVPQVQLPPQASLSSAAQKKRKNRLSLLEETLGQILNDEADFLAATTTTAPPSSSSSSSTNPHPQGIPSTISFNSNNNMMKRPSSACRPSTTLFVEQQQKHKKQRTCPTPIVVTPKKNEVVAVVSQTTLPPPLQIPPPPPPAAVVVTSSTAVPTDGGKQGQGGGTGGDANNNNDDQERFRDYQSKQWHDKLKELIEFKKQKGHCCVPHTYQDNLTLARWVKRQRYQYKLLQENKSSTMTEERITTLEGLGFIWDSHGSAWEERLTELKQYQSSTGHCNVPSMYCENPSLATWVKCQRRQYKLFWDGKASNMTLERITKLDKLGFSWELRAGPGQSSTSSNSKKTTTSKKKSKTSNKKNSTIVDITTPATTRTMTTTPSFDFMMMDSSTVGGGAAFAQQQQPLMQSMGW